MNLIKTTVSATPSRRVLKDIFSTITPIAVQWTKTFICREKQLLLKVASLRSAFRRRTMKVTKKMAVGIVLVVSDRPGKEENSALVSDERRFQRSLSYCVERVVNMALQ